MIQFVTFLSPNVGCRQQPFQRVTNNHLTKGHQQNCHEGVYDVFMAPTNLHLFHTDEIDTVLDVL